MASNEKRVQHRLAQSAAIVTGRALEGIRERSGKTMDPVVELEVEGRTHPEYSLEMSMTNRSSTPLLTYEHALPWVGWNSVILIAVKTDAFGTVIDKVSPIDDPGSAKITIKPGETLTGKISLVNRFPGFLEALKDRDVIVFWSYQMQPIDRTPLKRVAGYVPFPKLSNPGARSN